jgi:hypothetical protein
MQSTDLLIFFGIIVLIIAVSLFSKSGSNPSTNKKHNKPKYESKSPKLNTDTSLTYSSDEMFNNVVDFLQSEVILRRGKTKNEKDYQDDLYQRMSVLTERHGYEVDYESTNNRHRVDFSIDDRIGIELKVHHGGTLVKKQLFNQITDYAKYYDMMIGLVLNKSDKDTNEELKNDIKSKLLEQNVLSEDNYEIVVINI